jgi:electron transfer flavoprotein beta subunit
MGPEKANDAIRKALSMGAESGILITDPALAGSDGLGTARAIAAAVRDKGFDILICGTESFDGSTGMVPPQVAEILGIPHLSFAKKLEVDGNTVWVPRARPSRPSMPPLSALTRRRWVKPARW